MHSNTDTLAHASRRNLNMHTEFINRSNPATLVRQHQLCQIDPRTKIMLRSSPPILDCPHLLRQIDRRTKIMLRSSPPTRRHCSAASRTWLCLGLSLSLAGGSLACRSTPHRPTACSLRTPATDDAMTTAALIPAPVWLDLLAPDHLDALSVGDPHTCSGAPLRAESLTGRSRVLPRRTIDDRSLTIAQIGDDALVWARVLYYDDGDALGALGLLSRHEDQVDPAGAHLEVLAIGSLRAPAKLLELRVETLSDDAQVVITRGQRCPDEGSCVVEIQLLPWIGNAFVDAPLRRGEREAPARIRVHEHNLGPDIDGWRQESDIRRQVRAQADGLIIAETLRIRRCPSALPEACEEEASVHRERPLTFDGQRLYAPPSLWTDKN